MDMPDTTTAEKPKMTPSQYEAHARMQAQLAYRKRKVLLQHAYGLPLRKKK